VKCGRIEPVLLERVTVHAVLVLGIRGEETLDCGASVSASGQPRKS
jgi:hypothetical protein